MTTDLAQAVDQHADEIGDRLAIADGACRLTFLELRQRIERIRTELAETIPEGAALNLAAPDMNWCSWATAYLSVVTSGRIAVLAKAGSKGIPGPTLCITGSGGSSFETAVDYQTDGLLISIDQLRKLHSPLDIVFTSGSTGSPEPYAFDHQHFRKGSRIQSPRHSVRALHLGIPFNTSTGAHAILVRHLLNGWTSVAAAPVDWESFADVLDDWRPLELSSTPFALGRLLASPQEGSTDLVRALRLYAGPLSDGLREKLVGRFTKCRIASIYGLTEAGNTVMVRYDAGRRFVSTGGNSAFRVWNADQFRWADGGELGEIFVRDDEIAGAPISLTGAQSHTGPPGWSPTGDLGYQAADGAIRFWGRAKEIVTLNGTRQSAPELEDNICAVSPGIDAAVVFNMADGNGESLVVVAKSALSARRVGEESHRWGLECPIVVVLVDEIARTELGKTARMTCSLMAAKVISTCNDGGLSVPGGFDARIHDGRTARVAPATVMEDE